MPSDKLWLCGSHNGVVGAIILIRSPFKKQVEKKIAFLSQGRGYKNWTVSSVDEKEYEEILMNKFELNSLYEEETANA